MEPVQQHPPDSVTPPSTSRKRNRENETESQRHKREKAAERQRRKRERDRRAGLEHILSALESEGLIAPEPPAPPPLPDRRKQDEELSAEEAARREKVRAAARERQRKHRAAVKARKMRELGIDMGNDFVQGVEEVQFRMDEHGVYQQVLPHELQHAHMHPSIHEPPFPQAQANGGQTFASTLLLSFSCAPLLKAHLLRTLNMSNEELASLEPILAQAWDHWDQQRRMHYGGPKPPDTSIQDGSVPSTSALPGYITTMGATVAHANPYGMHDPAASATNDFRERFHRPLIAPSPFRSSVLGTPPQQQPQSVGPAMTTGGVQTPTHTQTSRSPTLESSSPGGTLDPQLGQSRDDAAAGADRRSRGE